MNRLPALLACSLALSCGSPRPPAEPAGAFLVANEELSPGAPLTESSFTSRRLPASQARPGMVAASRLPGVVGQRLRIRLAPGDFLLDSALDSEPSPHEIAKRFRAFSMPVVGGEHLRPGDLVDLVATVPDLATGETTTLTVMYRVPVWEVKPLDPLVEQASLGAPTPPTRQVAVLALPEEAEILAQALRLGPVMVSLRNQEDLDVPEERGRVTVNSLLGGERVKALQSLRYRTIQIIRGTGSTSGGWTPPRQTARPEPDGAALRSQRADEARARDRSLGAQPPQRLLDSGLDAPRLGKVLVRDDQGRLQPLPSRALRIVAQIEGPRARTIIDYVVENPTSGRLEGSFRWALPQDATPAYFGMFQGTPSFDRPLFQRLGGHLLPLLAPDVGALGDLGTLVSGTVAGAAVSNWAEFRPARVVQSQKGTQVYEKIVRPRIDPALLEWSGANAFEARVYPLAPQALKRVVLVYEETLPVVDGKVRYTFPLPDRSIDEVRYRVYVDEAKGRPESLRAGDRTLSVDADGKSGPFWVREVDLSGSVSPGDLELSVQPSDPRAQFLAGSSVPGLPGGFVFGRVAPEIPREDSNEPTGDAVFVLDTSLSEDGARAALSAQMLEAVLARDESIRRFNVLLFDVRARWLEPKGWIDNGAEGRARTVAELAKVVREGATSLQAALGTLEATPWLTERATAFLLSDGQLTWGETDPLELLARSPRSRGLRWITYQFGRAASNREVLESLAGSAGGRVVTCLSTAEVQALARAHLQRPMLVESVKVEGAPLHDLVVRGAPRAIYPGQELQVAGRVLGGAQGTAQLVIRGTFQGKAVEQRHAFPLVGEDMLAPRAWAELEVEQLLALRTPAVDRLVLALSQRFGLANRLASFLILETDQDYPRFHLKREAANIAEVEAEARRGLAGQRLAEAGLSLEKVPQASRELLAALPVGAAAERELAHQPAAGGAVRAEAEAAFRRAREKNPDDLLPFHALARARAAGGDPLGALRAVSSIVELRPGDCDALRMAAYLLLEQGEATAAAEALGEVRRRRPFEIQAYLEEALALVQTGNLQGAARNYEIALGRSWERHGEAQQAARLHYAQLLARLVDSPDLDSQARERLRARLATVQSFPPADLQLTLHWNVDDVDVDLLVTVPEGQQVRADSGQTRTGGSVLWNARNGYGPEVFRQRDLTPGPWAFQAQYRWNASEQWAIPAVVLGVLDERPYDRARFKRRFASVALPFETSTQSVFRTRL